MRAADHQLIQPLFVATFVKAGGKLQEHGRRHDRLRLPRRTASSTAPATARPTTCKMQRPVKPLELFLTSLLNGVTYGLLLFMLSSGLTLIFSMMGVLNFAHASFYMLGAYFGYVISTYVGFCPGARRGAARRWARSARWWSATGCAARTPRATSPSCSSPSGSRS